MDCGTSMVKYILFLFNTLCSICGVLLIVFGALLLNNVADYRNVNEAVMAQQIPVALIIFGSVVLFVSFLGCCGAIRESYCMTMTYSVFLLIVLIVQLVCVVYFWINKQAFVESMSKVIDKAWDERSGGADFMNAIQSGWKCCGKNGPSDYLTSLSIPPPSCCVGNICNIDLNIYTTGCKERLADFWSGKSDLIKMGLLIVVGIELVEFIFGCCLANNIRNYKRRSTY